MKFDDIENIWDVELALLSNADRGRLFFERAKVVVEEALADPNLRAQAVDGTKFRRDFLAARIGCGPAVANQNPRVRQLLTDTDAALALQSGRADNQVRPRVPGQRSPEIAELKATIDSLRRRLEIKSAEASDLRRQLREAGWAETELADHGRLPW